VLIDFEINYFYHKLNSINVKFSKLFVIHLYVQLGYDLSPGTVCLKVKVYSCSERSDFMASPIC
jgi:hypothetical protein